MVSLVGGGSPRLRPGEICLAHGGVLFLDEMGEFAPAVLDALREPLEEGVIRVARAAARRHAGPLPARRGHQPVPVRRGRARAPASATTLARRATWDACPGRCSTASICASRCSGPRSTSCSRRRRRAERGGRRRAWPPPGGSPSNAPGRSTPLSTATGSTTCAPLTAPASALLRRELERGRLTGRGLHRVRRVARTLADLDDASGRSPEQIDVEHVALALRCGPACASATPGLVGLMRDDAGHRRRRCAALAGFDLMTAAPAARDPRATTTPARRSRSPPGASRRTRAVGSCC